MPAFGVHQRGLPVNVARAPRCQGADHHPEFASLVGQRVLRARRMVRVEPARRQRVLFHALEPIREDVGRDPREALLEILESPRSRQHVTHEQEGPAIADQLERLRDGTGLAVALGHASSLPRS